MLKSTVTRPRAFPRLSFSLFLVIVLLVWNVVPSNTPRFFAVLRYTAFPFRALHRKKEQKRPVTPYHVSAV